MYGWRYLFFLEALGVIVSIYILLFVPESPAWLKARENRTKGIVGGSNNIAKAVKWTELLKGTNRKVLLLSISLCLCMSVAYWGTGAWMMPRAKFQRKI